jgi:hypothetical protein
MPSLVPTGKAVYVSVAISAIVCAGILGISRFSHSVSAFDLIQKHDVTALAPAPVRHGPTLEKWTFGPVPTGWTVEKNTDVRRRANSVDVVTSRAPSAYQLASPILTLRPGAYAVLVSGDVRLGGMELAAVDLSKRQFIVLNEYLALQQRSDTNFHNGRMFMEFALASQARIQIILANSARAGESRWRLESVSLVRQAKPCGCSPVDRDAWISR